MMDWRDEYDAAIAERNRLIMALTAAEKRAEAAEKRVAELEATQAELNVLKANLSYYGCPHCHKPITEVD